MKITKQLLREMIEEETKKILKEEKTPRQEISDAYGSIMNLLMGRGEWEKAGGHSASRADAKTILLPYIQSIMKAMMKIPK